MKISERTMIDVTMYQTKSFEEIIDSALKEGIYKLTEKYLNDKVLEYKHIGGGSFGLVYKVETLNNKTLVIKFYRLKGMNRTQVLEIETLKKYSSVKIPEVYFIHYKDANINVDAVGMEFVEGIPCVEINPNYHSKAKRQSLADEFTTALHSIHQAKSDKYGLLEDLNYDNWLDFYRPFAKELHDWAMDFGKDPKHKMSKEFLEVIDYAWINFDRIFNQPFSEPTLIHNDLCVCNFMVDKKTLKLTAIIDPNRAMYADVEYELHNLTNITGNRFYLYDTYKKKYGVSSNCDVKIAFYAIYNEIFYYLITQMSFEYIYPFMIKRLWREMKKHFAKENI